MQLVKSDIDIFKEMHPETGLQWLPGHWRAARLSRPYFCRLYTRFKELADEGYLKRDWPNTKKSKHSAWARTRKTDEHMEREFGEAPPTRSRTPFEHQILDDMDTASLIFGIEADKRLKWRFGPALKTEFEFDGGNRPIHIATKDEHIYRFKEIDRATENATRWKEKLANIKAFHEDKKKHGITRMFVSVITTNENMKRRILDVIKKEIGACKYIGVAVWGDWGNHDLSKGGQDAYPKLSGHTFTVAYERVGHAPMYLDRFWEC